MTPFKSPQRVKMYNTYVYSILIVLTSYMYTPIYTCIHTCIYIHIHIHSFSDASYGALESFGRRTDARASRTEHGIYYYSISLYINTYILIHPSRTIYFFVLIATDLSKYSTLIEPVPFWSFTHLSIHTYIHSYIHPLSLEGSPSLQPTGWTTRKCFT